MELSRASVGALLVFALLDIAFGEEAGSAVGLTSTTTMAPTESSTAANVTGHGLFQLYQGSFRTWVKKPLVHGLLLPGIIGIAASLLTVCLVCCVHTVIKSAARRRRRARIRNLAEELKTDKAALLDEDSDDDDFS